jgi:hypothetical protein
MSDKTILGAITTCPDCGIQFSIHKEVETLWRTSHKRFNCPNGHGLSWLSDTPQEVETKTLKARVEELEKLLSAALEQADSQKKRADELAIRLEIWEPENDSEK